MCMALWMACVLVLCFVFKNIEVFLTEERIVPRPVFATAQMR